MTFKLPELTAIILAGGKGSRLGELVKDTPKPMLSVNNRPFLSYLLSYLRYLGCKDILFCLGYKYEVIAEYLAKMPFSGVRFVREEEPLGTAGALMKARHLINSDPFVVLNGDSFCAVDFQEMLKEHYQTGAIATVATIWLKEPSRYGTIHLGERKTVTGFYEKKQEEKAGYINAGVYCFNQGIFKYIPAGRFAALEDEVFPNLIGKGLFAYTSTGLFVDIGTLADLERAQNLLADFPYPLL